MELQAEALDAPAPQLPCHVACAVLPGHCLLEHPHRPVSAPALLVRGWPLTQQCRVRAADLCASGACLLGHCPRSGWVICEWVQASATRASRHATQLPCETMQVEPARRAACVCTGPEGPWWQWWGQRLEALASCDHVGDVQAHHDAVLEGDDRPEACPRSCSQAS